MVAKDVPPDNVVPFDLALVQGRESSEDVVALRFTLRYRETLRFDHSAGRWYEWCGTHWRPDVVARAFHCVRKIARAAAQSSNGLESKGVLKASFAGGVERFCRSDEAHATDASKWDTDPMLLCTPAGTVDLRDGTLGDNLSDHMITRIAGVSPVVGDPVRWIEFLKQATDGDEGMMRFLQQWCGYCLTGDTREHALAFLYGPGGNGKSVFLNLLNYIMGDYAVTADMATFTESRGSQHPTGIAMLRGARLVTASETEAGKAWAETRIKNLTGGEPITARFMAKDFFTYRPQFKLTVVGNYAPELRNVDDAMRRRFNIIPFIHKPTTPDRLLEAKLRAEAGQILSWMIAGCLDWQANGLTRPDVIDAATAEYFEDNDHIGTWIAERCNTGRDENEAAGAMFRDWSSFAKSLGVEPGSNVRFADALKKRGYRRVKGRDSNRYTGLSLKMLETVENWNDR